MLLRDLIMRMRQRLWGADNNILWLKGIIFSMTVTMRYLGEARKGIGKTPDPSLELGFADLLRRS